MMRHAVLVAAFITVSATAVTHGAEPDWETFIAEVEKARPTAIRDATGRVKQLQRQIKRAGPSKKKQLAAQLREANEQLKSLRKGEAIPPVHFKRAAAMVKGQIASFPTRSGVSVDGPGPIRKSEWYKHHPVVAQVHSDKLVRCRWAERSNQFFILMDTTDLVEDGLIPAGKLYQVADPEEYTTVLGGRRKLPLLIPIPEKELKQKLKERAAD